MTGAQKKARVNELLQESDEESLLADGFEAAIIGVGRQFTKAPVIVYDYAKCIEILVKKGMTHDEAVEYFEFNTQGAWMGEQTPVFVNVVH
ncbi:MAG: hypothetical protein EHM14_15945 [Methanothrix sp.]|nr:MAG: hypothetical protein EHM14_15945 [Methanothrix sp.]